MNITLNNRPDSIDKDQVTISELLVLKNFTFKMLVMKVNGKLVKKDIYDSSYINDGDDVTVLHLVSGGWYLINNYECRINNSISSYSHF